ncbi:MAG TPA: hypothetical protein VKB38_18205 [Terracidiphilus sp.]|nr:hypothetical protein [Terracidiphilus sp.]
MNPLKMAGLGILILFLCPAASTESAAAETGAAQAATQQTTASGAAAASQPKVTSLSGNLEEDDLITVKIDHLGEWAATNDARKLVPYLNGLALRANYPAEIDTAKDQLTFHLRLLPENKHVWIDLLGAPTGIRRPITFSVGLEDQSSFDSVYEAGNTVDLTVISPWYGVIALIVIVLNLVVLIWLARTTSIIREPGPKPGGGKLRRYSLGRAQMAFWFLLIFTAYVVVWLITGALDTITPSLLALMGISAATGLSEAMIDSGKDAASESQSQDRTAEKRVLEQDIAQAQAQVTEIERKPALSPEDLSNRESLSSRLTSQRVRLSQISQEIQALTPAAETHVSAGFMRDILSDGNGVSFHRFQIFAWTIVLGIMFLSSVYNGLTMPEFSASLLGLMGISSGTYIGFKFPEQKSVAAAGQSRPAS